LLEQDCGVVDEGDSDLARVSRWPGGLDVVHEMGRLGAGFELPFQGIERAAGLGRAGIEEPLSVEVLREFGHSEGGDGVENRSGGTGDGSGGGGDEEVPAAAFSGFFGDLFEVAIVEDGHAHSYQDEFVDGLRDAFGA